MPRKSQRTKQYGSRLVLAASQEFLRAVRQRAPGVLGSLRDEVLPIYKEAWGAWLKIDEAEREDLARTPKVSERYLEVKRRYVEIKRRQRQAERTLIALEMARPPELERAIRSWAMAYHLTCRGEPPDWLLDVVEATLIDWAVLAPKAAALDQKKLVWSLAGAYEAEPDHGRLPPAHFINWAVDFQVRGIAIRSLTTKVRKAKAREHHDQDLVRFGVRRVLDLIGLSRRIEPPGRPRKTQ